MAEILRLDLGAVTSYALAVEHGYTGTEEQWAEKMTNCASQAALDALANDVYYTALAINTFTATPSQAEIGSTVNEVALAFALNKVPNVLTLDGVPQTLEKTGTYSLTSLGLTANRTFTLHAEDTGSTSHAASKPTKTATVTFLNRAYYGAAAAPETVNSAFLLALANGVLTDTRKRTISVNADSGKYIWYAVPKRFGACTFTVGGFIGGFEAAQEISHTNASGYTEAYYVYRSTNAGLGQPEIVIS